MRGCIIAILAAMVLLAGCFSLKDSVKDDSINPVPAAPAITNAAEFIDMPVACESNVKPLSKKGLITLSVLGLAAAFIVLRIVFKRK